MIKVICDGCGDESGQIDDSDWRTLVIDLGYLPGSHKHGNVDGLATYTFCHLCIDKVHEFDLTEWLSSLFQEGRA
jgi:hypothetical protein